MSESENVPRTEIQSVGTAYSTTQRNMDGQAGMSRGMGNPLPRPVFMPETFTGVNREWSDWSEQFEMAAEVNNWNDDLKLKFMSLLFSGRARDLFSGLSLEARTNYALLKDSMTKCLEPCKSADWQRLSFSTRRRLPNETVREFGNSLRRLITKAYPTVGNDTQDLLARDHFIAHVGTGETRIQLRSAKPATLESAVNLASELELIRGLELNTAQTSAKVCGVSNIKTISDGQMETLLGVVEGLRQEVKSLQVIVNTLQNSTANLPPNSSLPDSRVPRPDRPKDQGIRGDVCWECGSHCYFKKDCPYLQMAGNFRGWAR